MLKRGALIIVTFLIAGFIIVEFRITERYMGISPLAFFVFVALGILGSVPMGRHVSLFFKLEAGLIERLGPIWEGNREPQTLPLLFSGFKSELNEIETKYGAELTNPERALMRAARQQYNIFRAWVFILCGGLLLFMFFSD